MTEPQWKRATFARHIALEDNDVLFVGLCMRIKFTPDMKKYTFTDEGRGVTSTTWTRIYQQIARHDGLMAYFLRKIDRLQKYVAETPLDPDAKLIFRRKPQPKKGQ